LSTAGPMRSIINTRCTVGPGRDGVVTGIQRRVVTCEAWHIEVLTLPG